MRMEIWDSDAVVKRNDVTSEIKKQNEFYTSLRQIFVYLKDTLRS